VNDVNIAKQEDVKTMKGISVKANVCVADVLPELMP
jgi:hypothetical protein